MAEIPYITVQQVTILRDACETLLAQSQDGRWSPHHVDGDEAAWITFAEDAEAFAQALQAVVKAVV